MPNKMGKKSDDEKNKLKERARRVIGPVTPRPVAGNKEGRASEFYKSSRSIDFLMSMFPETPGKTGKIKVPSPLRKKIGPAKKMPIKTRGAR